MKRTEIEIDANLDNVDFYPATELKEIIQNVKTIITTVMGTVPLDRDFGINPKLIDLPVNVVKGQLAREVKDKIEKYEKRVKYKSIVWNGDGMTGHIYPKVRVEIK